MAHYLYQNNDVNVFPQDAINIKTELEPAIYNVDLSMAGYYLTRMSDTFTMPEKVYGDMLTHAKRIIETFADRSKRHLNTGALLSGVKGSGKTLQVKTIANILVKHMPVLMVNHGFNPSGLSEFLNTIDTRCCVIFDEFEKNFSSNNSEDRDSTAAQNGFLTMLDGTSSSNKLFLFTCNELAKINEYLLNRPGRIFYHFKFEALSEDTLKMYAEDRLNNIAYLEDLSIVKSRLGDAFTFDIMQSIVEESNRYNEAPSKFIKHMNLKVEHSNRKYTIYASTDRPGVAILRQPNDTVWIDFDDLDDFHIVTVWLGVNDLDDFRFRVNSSEGTRIRHHRVYSAEELRMHNEQVEKDIHSNVYADLLASNYKNFIELHIRVDERDLHYSNKQLVVDCEGITINYELYKYTTFNSVYAF